MPELLKYFDNGATSFPKPPEVGQFIQNYLAFGGTYGRGGYPRAAESTALVEQLRDKLAVLFGIGQPENIAFSANSTQAINTILQGLDLKGKDILISPLEHNAVTRPLEMIRKTVGTRFHIVSHFSDGLVDIDGLKKQINARVGLVVINHQSNVNGLIQPIAEIKKAIGTIPILVDASQSAGHSNIDCDRLGIDYLAFTGHKGLMGPTGIGGFYAQNPETIEPLIFGGTGSNSDSFEMPSNLPDKFQAGTPNMVGTAGLLGALMANVIPQHSHTSFVEMLLNIKSIEGLEVHCADEKEKQGETFSFRYTNENPGDTAYRLFQLFGLEMRSGLHCAPLAHKTLGSFPLGLVRISLSPFHTMDDLDYLTNAIEKASLSRKN
ncbi:MAG TPA: aminotransferase class V-fold PLP-dependent enzyme [Williamwhitmania sp.]|nr:aminotransferase class V-fold PLP-dependent enzyme [Williamwhitmania sp.]